MPPSRRAGRALNHPVPPNRGLKAANYERELLSYTETNAGNLHRTKHLNADPGTAPRRIVLTGFMGSGKSTVGPLVARQLGWKFVDADDVIAAEAGCNHSGNLRARR